MKFPFKKKKYKYGLALSGGGARGIAHLGAAKALKERGHTFDIIIGTSMGAIVGCLLADNKDPEEIVKLFTSENRKKFIKPEISRMGMMTMKGARDFLRKMLSVENIEDLPTPFIATATNLITGKAEYFKEGNIIDAVIASSSIPIIFAPTTINGQQYLDGGVLNNLPVRYIRHYCEKVAGFHVNPQSLGLYNGTVKNVMEMAERTFYLGMLGNVLPDIAVCDFFLEHSNLTDFSTFDFDKAEEIFQCGYLNTIEVLKTKSL